MTSQPVLSLFYPEPLKRLQFEFQRQWPIKWIL